MKTSDAHILVVDDDERIRGLLQKFLSRHRFFVTTARNAKHARSLLSGLEFDLIVLDVMMPGEDGISLTQNLRKVITTPIILLTAKSETHERILGLEAGADDYLSKPFEPKELILRINSILRRVPENKIINPAMQTVYMGDIHYDISRGELWRGKELIHLTRTEAVLMRVFALSSNLVVSREKLVEELRRDDVQSQERAVDVQITRLRRKLEIDPKNPRYLQTVRGAGYMLVPDSL